MTINQTNNQFSTIDNNQVISFINDACKKIAPLWSLENFVAVNPYLGLANQKFDKAMHTLYKIGKIQGTLPLSFYINAIKEDKIQYQDIQKALLEQGSSKNVYQFIYSLNIIDEEVNHSILSFAETVHGVNQQNWQQFITNRISAWASSYFDHNQASWKTTKNTGIFEAWRSEALIDRTPEIMGLPKFRTILNKLPKEPIALATYALKTLKIPNNGMSLYLHHLLTNIGGWAAYIARIDWDNNLKEKSNNVNALSEFLCILLAWEVILKISFHHEAILEKWDLSKQQLKEQVENTELPPSLQKKLTLQKAFDIGNQRKLIQKFAFNSINPKLKKPSIQAQAIFCIDVRSEVFRRNLEMVSPNIETLGFAGFFAFPIKYVPLGHEEGSDQCPVLLNTSHTILEDLSERSKNEKVIKHRKLEHHVKESWKSFKLGAISCFSFVGPIGLSYLPKLFTDSFSITRPVPHPETKSLNKRQVSEKHISLKNEVHQNTTVGIPLDERVKMAENALRGMSFIENFARTVLIVGHGSSSVNNPHATGLDCGACGGHTGEANSKVATAILNDYDVRKALAKNDINIPYDTIFVACQHNTTTDEIHIFNKQHIPSSHHNDIKSLEESLAEAGKIARIERAMKFNISFKEDIEKSIVERSKDWSQVRPEWGLAGCSSFVVAPRKRSKNLDLEGHSFLHSYEWKKDTEFKVLELIMTAPMIVTSWINLQYYASTVDNFHYGAGNKTLHNVVGGFGILEGYSGDLRTGLPIQSVHDGDKFQHEPLKLNVIIEAPIEEITKIINKHKDIKQLIDNQWIYLFAMNNEGKITNQYIGDLQWKVTTNEI